MKKLCSALFCLMLLAGAAALSALPACALSEGDWEYALAGEEATVTKYNGTDASVTVPATLGGKPVTGIGEQAFYGNEALTELTIQEGVTSIGRLAFENCWNMTRVMLPSTLKTVDEGAFTLCGFIERVEISDLATWCGVDFADEASNPLLYSHALCLNGELLTALTIPAGVESIKNYAFTHCDAIRTLTIPYGVKSIGDEAFHNVHELRTLTIPDSVTSIGEGAFELCFKLEELTLPSNLKTIGSGALRSCERLKHVTIPSCVTSIGEGVFTACYGLISAGPVGSGCSIEYGWTDAIPANAFFNNSLSVAVIPASITRIGEGAFVHNGSFMLKFIYGGTQSQWERLDGHIPDAYIEFGYRLGEQIIVESGFCDNVSYTLDHTGFLTLSGEGTIPGGYFPIYYNAWQGINTVLIEPGVLGIGERAFESCYNITKVTIPDSVRSIGSRAFAGCDLKSLTIPGSVSSIDMEAFVYCDSLIDLTISEGVTSIGISAFHSCKSLASVTLPRSLTVVFRDAFTGCDALTDVYFAGKQAEWSSISIAPENGPLKNAELHLSTVPEPVAVRPSDPAAVFPWVCAARVVGEELTLHVNSGVSAPVFLAAYDAKGRLVGVCQGTCTGGKYTLPVGADADKYEWKLMFVDAGSSAPLTCAYGLEFPA